MGKLFKSSKFKELFKAKKGSVAFTGIDPGRGTSNVDTAPAGRGRGRGRRADTPLGGRADQM